MVRKVTTVEIPVSFLWALMGRPEEVIEFGVVVSGWTDSGHRPQGARDVSPAPPVGGAHRLSARRCRGRDRHHAVPPRALRLHRPARVRTHPHGEALRGPDAGRDSP